MLVGQNQVIEKRFIDDAQSFAVGARGVRVRFRYGRSRQSYERRIVEDVKVSTVARWPGGKFPHADARRTVSANAAVVWLAAYGARCAT
jgi:hypothetical protein